MPTAMNAVNDTKAIVETAMAMSAVERTVATGIGVETVSGDGSGAGNAEGVERMRMAMQS